MGFFRFFYVFFTIFFLFNAGFSWAEPVFFTFISEDGHYNFEGGFTVKADPDVVWNVLTDYNHVSSFISNMHSRVKKENGNDLIVQQDAGGGFLIIQEHIKALLDIHEDPFQSISFNDVSHKNFELYSGVWHLQPEPLTGETKVTYELLAARDKDTPSFLTPDLFSGSLGDLLAETQKEIDKRQFQKEKMIFAAVQKSPTVLPTPFPTPVSTVVEGSAPVSQP